MDLRKLIQSLKSDGIRDPFRPSKWDSSTCALPTPSTRTPVVIDRHAHDIAVREVYGQRDRGLGAVGQYNALADCYRDAAQKIGEVPSKVQAVTWVAHIERK
ncbi:DUF7178 family protein [Streptomyces sp. NPDC055793]